MADGKVTIDTRVDVTGAKSDMKTLGKEVKQSASEVSESSKIKLQVDASQIERILNDTEKTARSKAGSIASYYKQAGYDSSEAMKMAWVHVKDGTSDINKVKKRVKESRKEIDNATSSTKKWKSSADDTCTSFESLKRVLASVIKKLALVFSIRAIINFGKQAVELASDLAEVQNVVDVSFGSMTYKMEEFAETSIETFGMSKLSAKQMGSTFMAMGRGMGQGLEIASDKAIEMTGRMGDIASFYNKTLDEVNTIGRAVYSGETEPLKQIGVIMTQTELETFALARGYKTLYKNMSAEEKLLVRQEFFLEKTSLAAGDFVRTQDSWANQTKILSENWKEFMSVIGSSIITVLTPLIKTLNQVVSTLTKLATALQKSFGKVFGIVTQEASGTSSSIENATESMDEFGNSVENASKKSSKSVSGFDKLNVTSTATATSGGTSTSNMLEDLSTEPIEDVAEDTESIFDSALQHIKDFIDTIDFTPLKKKFNKLKDSFLNVFDKLKEVGTWLLDNILLPLTKWTIEDALPAFFELLAGALDLILAVAEPVLSFFKKLWEVFLQPVAEFVGDVFVATMETLGRAMHDISQNETAVTILSSLVTVILLVVAAVKAWSIAQAVLNAIMALNPITLIIIAIGLLVAAVIVCITYWDELKAAVIEVWQSIKETISNVIETICDYIKTRISNIASWWSECWYNLKFKTSQLWEGIKSSILNVITTMKSGISNSVSSISNAWSSAFNSIKTTTYNIFNGIWSFIKNIINSILGGIQGMCNGIISGINVVIRTLNNLSFDIPEWVPDVGGKKFGFNISQLGYVSIPRLASGAVIPPNNEFLAVLGDQKSGTNIEAPLSTIKQAVAEVLTSMNGGSSNNGDIVVQIDGREIFRAVQKQSRKYEMSTGLKSF